MKVGMFGTFDIGNFGDIFFPIVAEKKLAELGPVEVQKFSYREMKAESWCFDVDPIQTFPEAVPNLDLVIVGGGHLIHFSRKMAMGYAPLDPRVPHPLGFWWLPAVFGAASGLPVALHGVSADPLLPDWADPLMRAFVDSIDYASVRDEKTRALLMTYARPGREIALVPDSVFSVSDFIVRGIPSAAFTAFCEDVGLARDYMIIQPSHALRRFKPEIVELARAARARGWDVLELPIGYEMGNDVGFYDGLPGLKLVKDWPNPLLLAEIIANAQAVAGVSLHLSIVASAYGIPVYRTPFSPNSKYILLNTLPNISFLGQATDLRGLSDAAPDLTAVEAIQRDLNVHWRRLYDMARAPGPNVRPRGWEQLCATPEAFRQNQSAADRKREFRAELIRRRQWLWYQIKRRGGARG